MKQLKMTSDGAYTFVDDDEQLSTPGGTPCVVKSKELAERILADWEECPDSFDGDCSLPWIYTYQENFARMGEAKVREVLVQCFKKEQDWTFHCPSANPSVWMTFRSCFGEFTSQWKEIEVWLGRLNLYQLTAACCVGNAFQSLNVAFVFSFILETEEEEPGEREAALDNIAELIEVYQGEDRDFVRNVYALFELFWKA